MKSSRRAILYGTLIPTAATWWQMTSIGCVSVCLSVCFCFCLCLSVQWRRQCSKGARSLRGQNILEPGHPDALFSSKKFTHTITEAKQSNRQGGARTVDLPARSFDLARPGLAPPLCLWFCVFHTRCVTLSRALTDTLYCIILISCTLTDFCCCSSVPSTFLYPAVFPVCSSQLIKF